MTTWRTATETEPTSAYQFFQTAYVDQNGNIEGFSSGTNRIDKYISNDFTSLYYFKNLPYNLFYAHRDSNLFGRSKNGTTWDEVTKTPSSYPYDYLGRLGNRIYLTGSISSTPKILYSDDNGATFSSFNATGLVFSTGRLITANSGTEIFVAEYDGKLWKLSGTSWTEITQPTDFNITSVTWDGTRLIISGYDSIIYEKEFHYSTNSGTSWTQIGTDNLDATQYFPADLKFKDGVYYCLMWDSFDNKNEIKTSSSITSPSWVTLQGGYGTANNPDGRIIAIISPTKILFAESVYWNGGNFADTYLMYSDNGSCTNLGVYDDGTDSFTISDGTFSKTTAAYSESKNLLLLSIADYSGYYSRLVVLDLNLIDMSALSSPYPTGKTMLKDASLFQTYSYCVGVDG